MTKLIQKDYSILRTPLELKALISLALLTGTLDQSWLYMTKGYGENFMRLYGQEERLISPLLCICWLGTSCFSMGLGMKALTRFHPWVNFSVAAACLVLKSAVDLLLGDSHYVIFQVFTGLLVGIASGSTFVIPIHILWYNSRKEQKSLITGLFVYLVVVWRYIVVKMFLNIAWVNEICNLSRTSREM